MRLPQKIFRIDTYISPDEAYHFTRKEIPLDPPLIEHSHDFFELLMVEQGAVHHWINGLEERLEAGTLVFPAPLGPARAAIGAGGDGAHPERDVPRRHRRTSGRALRAGSGRAILLVRARAADDAPPRGAAARKGRQRHAHARHRPPKPCEDRAFPAVGHDPRAGHRRHRRGSRPRMADPRLPRSPRAARVPAGRGGVSGRRRPEPGTCLPPDTQASRPQPHAIRQPHPHPARRDAAGRHGPGTLPGSPATAASRT